MAENTKKLNKERGSFRFAWLSLGLLILVVGMGFLFSPSILSFLRSELQSGNESPGYPDAVDMTKALIQIESKLREEYDLRLKSELGKELERVRADDEEKQKPSPSAVLLEMPKGIVADINQLSNGIPLRTEVVYGTGEIALDEFQLHDSYTATYQMKLRNPRPATRMSEIERGTPELAKILPGLIGMFATGFVSPWHETLYRNKISEVRANVGQLNRVISKPNIYDCNTILHLQSEKGRKVFLMQADMDAIVKGSDGDRSPVMPASQVDSIDYDPFTAYHWAKIGKAPNPMIAGWERRIAIGIKERDHPEITPEKKIWIEQRIDVLKASIAAMKKRSYLISAHDPYIVLPIDVLTDHKDPYAPEIGDYAVVIYGRKIYPCIVGDAGPNSQVGEASARLATALVSGWNSAQKAVGYPGVCYLVFPGSREINTSAPDHKKWRAQCLALLAEIGGLGEGYEYHDWTPQAP
jgi:hypothetical protein